MLCIIIYTYTNHSETENGNLESVNTIKTYADGDYNHM